MFTGQNIIALNEAASTNEEAAVLIRKNPPPEGTLIIAQRQTSGKGQRGNTWLSEPGQNLTFSIIFYPVFLEPDKQFFLSKTLALGVFDFTGKILGQEVKIKWPNDIYCGDKKIGGMLIENTIGSHKIISSVAGIGLNINQVAFPGDLPNPSSFRKITGILYSPEELLADLCLCIEARYLQLKGRRLQAINSDYLSGLYRFGERSLYSKGGKCFYARITDVSDDGKLELQKENGKKDAFEMKEISFVI